MKIKSNAQWKSIPLSHGFFTNLESASAVCGGIEELSDYTLVTKGKKSGKVLKRPLSCPKKTSLTIEENEPPPKKVAKKNVFHVVDSDAPGEVIKQEVVKKEKKAKNKKSKTKQNINLEALGCLVTSTENKENKVVKENTDLKELKLSKSTKKQNNEKPVKSKSKPDKSKKKIKNQEGYKDDFLKPVEISQMTEWKEIFVCDEIIKVLAEKGFRSPTPIQKQTLPPALKEKMDIVGAAETGSGKTLAFGIPIIQGIIEDRKKEALDDNVKDNEDEVSDEAVDEAESAVNVIDDIDLDFDVAESVMEEKVKGDKLRAVILTPTRELALQIYKHVSSIGRSSEVGVVLVVGGLSVEKQIRLLNRRPSVIVATPGRLWDLVQEGHGHLTDMSDVKYLAIDETDRMVEKGHFEELQKLLEMMNTGLANHGQRQTFIMSATLSLVHKKPSHVKKKRQMTSKQKLGELMQMVGVKDRRKIVDLTRKSGTAETLSESILHCATNEKDYYLYYFLKNHPGRTVVFCNSIDCVRRLANLFSLMDVKPLPLHAQLHQKQRLKNLDRFAESESGLLIATDVAARGLDIPNIEHVIHYQVPRTSESYVHRSGRTARATKQGLSLLLVDPSEHLLVRRLCDTLSRGSADTLPVFPVDMEMMTRVRERVNITRKLDKLLLDNRKQTAGENWKQKTAEEADLIVSDEDEEEEIYQGRKKTSADKKNQISQVRWQLQQSLKIPLSQHGFGGAYPTMSGGVITNGLIQKEEKAVDVLEKNLKYTKKLLRGKKTNTVKKPKFKKKQKSKSK